MIQTIHTIRIDADHARSPLRALGSLTSVQADQIVAGLSSLAGTWDIVRHESCDGHLSLLIAHAAHDTTLLVERDPRGIRLNLVLGDQVYPGTHRYASTSQAVSAIKDMAVSPTIHNMQRSA
ncbi:MAG: hypothetical protein ACRYG8_17705 [Janthinobacterium lividum]